MAGPDYKECNCGWLPIETAPKDGSRVLLWRESSLEWARIVIGQWDTERFVSKPRPYWTHDLERLTGKAEARKTAVTHWQPLPAPPLHPGRGV